MRRQLFRQEALANIDRMEGSIVVHGAWPSWAIFGGFGGLILVVSLALFQLRFSRSVIVGGTVEPTGGAYRVQSVGNGILLKALASDGAIVQEGQPVFLISSDQSNLWLGRRGGAIRSQIEEQSTSVSKEIQARQSLQQKERIALSAAISANEREQSRMNEILSIERKRLEALNTRLRIYRDLEEKGYAGAMMRTQREEEVWAQEANISGRLQERDKLEKEHGDLILRSQQLREKGELDIRPLERRLSELNLSHIENEMGTEVALTAPVTGKLYGISIALGNSVGPGQILGFIAPSEIDLEVSLDVPSKNVGLVKVGMPVVIRVDSFPYQKYGTIKGIIRELSAGAIPQSPSQTETQFRAKVKISSHSLSVQGQSYDVRPGMLIQAVITLETRRLYEWLMEPLQSSQWIRAATSK